MPSTTNLGTEAPNSKPNGGLHAHITICISPDGRVDMYPEGDPERVATALKMVVRMLSEHPERLRCAAGACDGGCHHE